MLEKNLCNSHTIHFCAHLDEQQKMVDKKIINLRESFNFTLFSSISDLNISTFG
jgi:hypothetical protein